MDITVSYLKTCWLHDSSEESLLEAQLQLFSMPQIQFAQLLSQPHERLTGRLPPCIPQGHCVSSLCNTQLIKSAWDATWAEFCCLVYHPWPKDGNRAAMMSELGQVLNPASASADLVSALTALCPSCISSLWLLKQVC